ncbi:MAG: hypothetical protein E7329_08745 [Clostridiales bacterium]|nr:hypothetical protein [Clostridiales bacterium]
MQNKAKNNKKKRELVYKPYKKGVAASKMAAVRGAKTLIYYILFVFLYIILGASMQFENTALRIIANFVLVLACGMMLYMDGAKLGESEAALGEITLQREQSGKNVHPQDAQRCYNPAKGWFMMLIGVLPLLVVTVPYAIFAQKQVYVLQGLPSWVSGFEGHDEISLPLAYYTREGGTEIMDLLRLIVRVLVFPFANMATAKNPDAMLLVDRLSPILASLPSLGFALGYLTGPLGRAMVHGDIASSTKRHQRKIRKAIKARREKAAKKNEII